MDGQSPTHTTQSSWIAGIAAALLEGAQGLRRLNQFNLDHLRTRINYNTARTETRMHQGTTNATIHIDTTPDLL